MPCSSPSWASKAAAGSPGAARGGSRRRPCRRRCSRRLDPSMSREQKRDRAAGPAARRPSVMAPDGGSVAVLFAQVPQAARDAREDRRGRLPAGLRGGPRIPRRERQAVGRARGDDRWRCAAARRAATARRRSRPGRVSAIVWPSRTTRAAPAVIRKKPVPTSPWRTIVAARRRSRSRRLARRPAARPSRPDAVEQGDLAEQRDPASWSVHGLHRRCHAWQITPRCEAGAPGTSRAAYTMPRRRLEAGDDRWPNRTRSSTPSRASRCSRTSRRRSSARSPTRSRSSGTPRASGSSARAWPARASTSSSTATAAVLVDGQQRASLARGEFFGEVSILLGESPVADVVALTPAALHRPAGSGGRALPDRPPAGDVPDAPGAARRLRTRTAGGAEPNRPFPPGDYPVVVVGSGPGGLQVSYSLRRLGSTTPCSRPTRPGRDVPALAVLPAPAVVDQAIRPGAARHASLRALRLEQPDPRGGCPSLASRPR